MERGRGEEEERGREGGERRREEEEERGRGGGERDVKGRRKEGEGRGGERREGKKRRVFTVNRNKKCSHIPKEGVCCAAAWTEHADQFF